MDHPVPLRLLVIEDAPDDAALLQWELRRAGYGVTMRRVENLPEMEAALNESQWDLVVSDHSMPGMTSFSALKVLRAHNLDLPFIIFSGGIGEEEAVAAMRAGANDYIMKGNVARLVPAIARELKQAEARRERRVAEAAVRELEKMREFALESAHIGEWEVELATRAFRPSRRFLRLFGQDAALSEWSCERLLEQVASKDRTHLDEAIRRALDEDAELDVEFRAKWADQSTHWLWARARRFAPEDRPPVLAGIMVDITPRKETEAQLHQALKMEAVGQLTGGIAHDFNNLLTVILGNSGLLQEAVGSDPELGELVDSIHSAGRSGAELTKRLLAFARQQPLQINEIDLAQYLRETNALLRQPLPPGITLDLSIAEDLPRIRIDPSQLSTALLNLVINARDAMPDGGTIAIAVARLPSPSSDCAGGFVQLTIADTGSGMPPEVAARAIEPFFTTKEVGKGTGLGLSMVYGFVRQSGGKMAIDSAPGRGTTIKIHLPAIVTATSDAPTPERAPIRPMPRPTTILIVDDDRAVRSFLVAVARGLGHRIVEAADGAEALAALKIAPEIELLFSDVAMPNGMTGYQLAAAARQVRPGVKILLTSGFPAKAVLQSARLDPDIRVLQKPYDPSELAAKITGVLED